MSEEPSFDAIPANAGLDDLIDAELYEMLRAVAARALAGKAPLLSVDATELVHECFLKIARHPTYQSLGRTEFLALAATIIRRILVDRERMQRSQKRGNGWQRITLSGLTIQDSVGGGDVLSLNESLKRLTAQDRVQGRIVELRFFGGMQETEIAEYLGLSAQQVHSEWVMAKAWLRREIKSFS